MRFLWATRHCHSPGPLRSRATGTGHSREAADSTVTKAGGTGRLVVTSGDPRPAGSDQCLDGETCRGPVQGLDVSRMPPQHRVIFYHWEGGGERGELLLRRGRDPQPRAACRSVSRAGRCPQKPQPRERGISLDPPVYEPKAIPLPRLLLVTPALGLHGRVARASWKLRSGLWSPPSPGSSHKPHQRLGGAREG